MAVDREQAVWKLNGMLKAMGQELEMPDLKLDEQGTCFLAFGEEFMLRCELDTKGAMVTLYACLGSIPEESPEFLQRFLAANYFWKETAGARIGLDPEVPEDIVLTQAMAIDFLDDELFYKNVERFVNAIDYWEKRLTALEETQDKGAFLELPSPS
ncbi:MAG: type III secretion system chaperone [Puniceicoccales bacterium]|jgi:hypothetical protein|nr:type III secretion system chaperone [Puniceicoccales bacterium]